MGNAPTVSGLTPTDTPPPGTYEALFALLDTSSRSVIGPAVARLLVIPIHDDAGNLAGGLWATTMFAWLHVQMLFVPEKLRGKGVGTILMREAERAARGRGCGGACVDTFSFQATDFYEKLGYVRFGVLENYPPGYQRVYYRKTLGR